jgi:hypothetical protein
MLPMLFLLAMSTEALALLPDHLDAKSATAATHAGGGAAQATSKAAVMYSALPDLELVKSPFEQMAARAVGLAAENDCRLLYDAGCVHLQPYATTTTHTLCRIATCTVSLHCAQQMHAEACESTRSLRFHCLHRDRRRPWVSLSEAVFQDELFASLFASEANSKIRQLLLAGADGGGLRLVVRAYAYAHPYLVLSHADSLVYVFSLSGSALFATHCCFLRPLSCLALFENSRRRHSSTSRLNRQRSLWL